MNFNEDRSARRQAGCAIVLLLGSLATLAGLIEVARRVVEVVA